MLLCGVLTLGGLLSPDTTAAQVLDRVEIVETPTAAEIHIVFNTRAIYLRHTPADQGDFIQVLLNFPDLDRSISFARELAASPPSDLVPKFTVIFPDQARNGLAIKFSQPVRFRISQRDMRSSSRIVISVPLEKPAVPLSPEAKAPPPTPAPKEKTQPFNVPPFRPGMNVETYAADLMRLAQKALIAGENEKALQILNAILNLPPNKQLQGAQEWIGVARERNGDYSKAKTEFELYLKLYPEGEGAARVRQRLVALQEAMTQVAQRKAGRTPKKIDETRVYGSIYSYYYGGYSQQKTTEKDTNSTTQLNLHDQSLLVSAFDVTGRYRKNEYDNKLVVRGTQSYDMLATNDLQRNVSRLRALYAEHSSQDSYFFRVGRQPGNTGGVLDYRFDGAWARYAVAPQFLNLNLVAGQPRQFSLTSNFVPDDPRNFRADLKHYFYGANVDIGPFATVWSGNLYYFNQMVNGVVDRRAVGTELRYASSGRSAFSLVDYDISYGVLNVAMLNGSWVTEGTTYTLLADHRRTPFLQTTNGLLGTGATSIEVINSGNASLLRTAARQVTPTSDLFLVGVLHAVTKTWQLGADARLNRIGGTSATNCLVILPGTSTVFLNPNATTDAPCTLQAAPGTGSIWTYGVQAIGTDVPFKRHTFVINANYITSPAYHGDSVTLNSLGRYGEKWQLDLFLILYHQKDSSNVTLYRGTPSFRVNYRFLDNWMFETSAGVEKTITDSVIQHDSTLREFFFSGIRCDF